MTRENRNDLKTSSRARAVAAPVVEDHEAELRVEKTLARYSATTPDFKNLDVEDWQSIKLALDYLRCNRRTGAWLPARRQLDVLEQLDKFPALQVAFACVAFVDGGGIQTKKNTRYFMGIVRGSALTKYKEVEHARTKKNPRRFEMGGGR